MTELILEKTSALHWREYFALCKPKVVALIVFTAVVGMLLSTPGPVPLDALVFGTLGIALGAASGAAVNQWVDQRIDAVMDRTHNRPLPQGRLSSRAAIGFALSLGVLSMAILLLFVNPLTALLTFIAMIGYAVVYTMFLKRSTPQNIVLGGAAGAAPPVLGWAAVTGEVHSDALLLFLVIFVWTPPHFWALAIKRRKEYAKAGIPMLPVTHGVAFTKLSILLYTLVLVAVTLMPFLTQMCGSIYLVGALALGIGFVYHAVVLYRSNGDDHAMKTFGYSIFYLSALFAFLLADHYALLAVRAFL
jgi:protoheme IX farnesyltransferase